MKTLRTTTLIGLFALFILVLAACGGSASTGSTTAPSSSTPAATPTTSNGSGSYSYGSSGATPTTSASTSGSASVVKIASAQVNGKSATILTDAKGMTLYYFTADTKTTSACGSGCTGTWPALMLTGSSQPASVAGLSGKLTVVADANGQQVQYNGHFLYTYSGDTAAGQTNGEGIGGKWFVATSSLS